MSWLKNKTGYSGNPDTLFIVVIIDMLLLVLLEINQPPNTIFICKLPK